MATHMPWVKSFDEEQAVDQAMQVFWLKGFDSASITDLLRGTGLNKGSLYNAFGGKRQLFVRTLEKYDRERRQALLAQLEAGDDPVAAINGFLCATVESSVADPERKGCFLVNTALDVAAQPEDVQALVVNGLREIEAFFRRCIEVGQARKVLRSDINPTDTAKALLGVAVSIRVLGRGVYTEESLHTLVAEARRLFELPAGA